MRGDAILDVSPRRPLAASTGLVGLVHRPVLREVSSRGVVLLLQLLVRAPVEPVAEDRALAVVGLVLEAPGQQAVAGVADLLAVAGPARGPRPSRAGRTGRTRQGRTGTPRRTPRGAARDPRGRRPSGCRPRPRSGRPSSSGQSKTKTERSTPIWQAASPTPSAAYIVATMSATRDRRSSSNAVHRLLHAVHDRGRPTGSPGGPCRRTGARREVVGHGGQRRGVVV